MLIRHAHRFIAAVAGASLLAGVVGCHDDSAKPNAAPTGPMESRIVAAVRAPTRAGTLVTAGLHITLVGTRSAPPNDAIIRAILVAAQGMIRDSATTPTTLAAAVTAGRDVPVLTQALTMANPVPSYTVRQARFTWISSNARVTLTNDQCVDHRQRFVAVAGAPDTYVCAPVNLVWQPAEATE